MRSKAKLAAALVASLAAASLLVASRRVPPLLLLRTAPLRGAYYEAAAAPSSAEGPPRRLVAVAHSDPYAETVLSVVVDDVRIAARLGPAGGLLDMADEVFGEAWAMLRGSGDDYRRLVRDGEEAEGEEDGERPLDETADAVRHLYEQLSLDGQDTIGFPECQGRILQHCQTVITRYLRDNGLLRGSQKIDIQIIEKRPTERDPDDEGANKVVIITNPLGDAVAETPKYPDGWTWNDRSIGPWPSCVGKSPAECCLIVREDVPDRENGRAIECQFYTPGIAGSDVRYPQPTDEEGNPVNGIILYKSVDGNGTARVEETPYIQADFALPP